MLTQERLERGVRRVFLVLVGLWLLGAGSVGMMILSNQDAGPDDTFNILTAIAIVPIITFGFVEAALWAVRGFRS